MNLQTQLNELKKSSAQNLPKYKWDIMLNSTNELSKIKLANGSLNIGDKMVDFELPNALGSMVTLSSLLLQEQLIISFYRGGWCPYCNLELKALQAILPQIIEQNASLVAISPETPDSSLTTLQKNSLEFPVLSDVNNIVAKKMGLVFQMPQNLKKVYHSFNIDVAKHNGNKNYELPMPATYIINKTGKVIYKFVAEDYTQRVDPEEILSILKTTNNGKKS